MIEIRFTHQAEADFFSIHDYTLTTFGSRQWVAYEISLRTALLNLQSNPLLGVDRSAIRANVRARVLQSHVIYYRLDPTEIVVLTILGVEQDPGRHL